MGYRDHLWAITTPREHGGGWTYRIVSPEEDRTVGPFETEHAAWHAQHVAFQRWTVRARARGGWAFRRTAREWVVTVPEDVELGGFRLGSSPVKR